MKKLISLFCVLAALLTLFGCNTPAPDECKYETNVVHIGSFLDPVLYEGSLNPDIPIHKLDTLADLEKFKEKASSSYTLGSFYAATEKYDEAFFAENSLLIIGTAAGSGSYDFKVKSVSINGIHCTVSIDKISSIAMTTDMAAWFITVAIPDAEISYCTEFEVAFQTVKDNS